MNNNGKESEILSKRSEEDCKQGNVVWNSDFLFENERLQIRIWKVAQKCQASLPNIGI